MKICGISGHMGCGKDTAADRLISKFGFTKVALADPIKRYGQEVFHFTEEQLWGPSSCRNSLDPRFQTFVNEDDGDDAWMAVFRRADKYNRKFVEELFPDSPLMRGHAHASLCAWLLKLATEHPQVSPRIVLQSLGTEWGRAVRPDVWLRHAILTGQKVVAGGFVYNHVVGVTESPSTKSTCVVISDIRFSNELVALKAAGGFLIRVVRPATDGNATQTGLENHPSEEEQRSFTDDQFNYIINNAKGMPEFLEAVDVAGFILTGASA